MTSCPACGAESARCYRCSECGKDLVAVDDDDGREVVTDGGQINKPTTHDVVLEQIDALQDESGRGAPIGKVVDATLEETEVGFRDVLETIIWQYNHERIYQPDSGYLRRTDQTIDLNIEGGR